MNKRIFQNLSEEEFHDRFKTEDDCLQFLALNKWENDSYTCKKCGNTNYCIGKTPFSRRCTRCKHDESARVDTIFHGCKIPLTKAFYIAFTVCHTTQISSHELSRRLELRQMTCWKFKKKLTECLLNRDDISEDEKTEIKKYLNDEDELK